MEKFKQVGVKKRKKREKKKRKKSKIG